MSSKLDQQELEAFAVDLINRLLAVIQEQKQTITQYEGAIEGIKLFMQELNKRIKELEISGRDKDRADSEGASVP